MKLIRLFPIILCLFVISFVYASSLEFNLSDLQGKDHKLSDYKGKWVVVNYWATWCPPCVKEMPELNDFHAKHSKFDAVVLGVNFENASEQKVKEFLENSTVEYPILLAEPDSYGPLGKVTGLPTTFIVSPGGEVVHKKVGAVDTEYLENVIAKYKHQLGYTTIDVPN